eukprot:PhM_4_TR15833/c0_g1_i1/m.72959
MNLFLQVIMALLVGVAAYYAHDFYVYESLCHARPHHHQSTWLKVNPAAGTTAPPERLAHAAVGVHSKMYVHGGMYGTKPAKSYGDMWIYTEATDVWRQINAKGEAPSPRLHHCLVYDGDKSLYTFGGFNAFMTDASHDSLDDFFKFDVETETWAKVKSANAGPKKRGAHDCIFADGGFFVFGGFEKIGAQGHKPELWQYDVKTNTWRDLSPADEAALAKTPAGRIGFSWAVAEGEALLFSGGCDAAHSAADADGHCRDLWAYNWKTNTWRDLGAGDADGVNAPVPRRATHGDVNVHNMLFMFGGVQIQGPGKMAMMDDFWVFDPKQVRWMRLHPNYDRGARPPKTFGHTIVRLGKKVVLFGGRTETPTSPGSNQLWEYETIAPLS